MQIAMIEDKILEPEQIGKAYFDRGTYFGDGVYDVLRSYNSKIFALDEHMERLSESLSALDIQGVDIEKVRERIDRAFNFVNYPDVRIYLQITRGCEPRNHNWSANLEPTFFLTVEKLGGFTELKAKGIAVSTYPDLRWKRCDIKSLNLLANVLAHQDASKKGCYDAILLDADGLITEGSSSAFFQIFGNTILTTPLSANILPSITRSFILKAAENIGLEIIEKQLSPQEAKTADELVIGATTRDVLGIVKFDDETIGDGRIGTYTKLLDEQFRLFTK